MHSKGSHKQDEKTTLRMGENISKRSNLKGIHLQNIQTAHTTPCQKTNNLIALGVRLGRLFEMFLAS